MDCIQLFFWIILIARSRKSSTVMREVLWRGNHTLKFRSGRLYQSWPSVGYISGMHQYSARPLRRFFARTDQLISVCKLALTQLNIIKMHLVQRLSSGAREISII